MESGPSGGAILAARLAERCGIDEIVSFDMRGTTAKFCMIDNGKPLTSRSFEAARAERFIKGRGMPLRIPAIEMIEIGNGPLHATRVAAKTGVSRVIVPTHPGVGSAVGFLSAPPSYEIVSSLHTTLDSFDFAGVNRLLEGRSKHVNRAH